MNNTSFEVGACVVNALSSKVLRLSVPLKLKRFMRAIHPVIGDNLDNGEWLGRNGAILDVTITCSPSCRRIFPVKCSKTSAAGNSGHESVSGMAGRPFLGLIRKGNGPQSDQVGPAVGIRLN